MDYLKYENWLAHSKGPWKKHKYLKKIGSKYFYSNRGSGSNGKDGYEDVPDEYDWRNDPRVSEDEKYSGSLYSEMSSYGNRQLYDAKTELSSAEKEYNDLYKAHTGNTAGTYYDPGDEKVSEAKQRLVAARENYNREAKAVVDDYYSRKQSSETVRPNIRPQSRKRGAVTSSGGVKKGRLAKTNGRVGAR